MRAHTHAAFNENCYWWLLLSVYFLRGSLAGLETRSGSRCYSLLIKPSQLLRSTISCLFCHRDAVDVSSLQMLPLKCRCSSARPKTSAERSNRQRDNEPEKRRARGRTSKCCLQTLFIKLTTSFAQFQSQTVQNSRVSTGGLHRRACQCWNRSSKAVRLPPYLRPSLFLVICDDWG